MAAPVMTGMQAKQQRGCAKIQRHSVQPVLFLLFRDMT
jgi:hypothetical protein